MKDYTEIVFILDKSGSMHGLEEANIDDLLDEIEEYEKSKRRKR